MASLNTADLDLLTEALGRAHETSLRLHQKSLDRTEVDGEAARLLARLRRSLGSAVEHLETLPSSEGPRRLRDSDFPPIVQAIRRGPALAFSKPDEPIPAKGDNFINRGRITDTEPGGAA